MLNGIVNAWLADPSLVEPGQYVNIGNYTAYPYSRGSIHVTDKDNVTDGYEFDAGFLNHQADVTAQVWAYKLHREIARRLPYCKGPVDIGHPRFREGSKAALADWKLPGEAQQQAGELEDIEYDSDDDAVIEQFIRENVNTTWHSIGTCAMRPKDEGGVVDKDLNVYGTQGLKVVDLSICPGNVGANTNNTALAVGEKAAVIIGKEFGIQV